MFHAVFYLGLFFEPEVPLERQLAFNGLHGVMSQKIQLFSATGVTTSNPAAMHLQCTNKRLNTN
jgi:hypothetical protein